MTKDLDLYPHNLWWNEVDPRLHPFDAASALAEVTALGPARRVPPRPAGQSGDTAFDAWRDEACAWTQEMTQALLERYGRWAVGWRWSLGEGGIGGGPVGAWCCPAHSITTPAETLAEVADGLCDWRSWLEELAELFDRFAVDAESAEDRRAAWERGTIALVTRVVDRTEAGDAWYGRCEQVLAWYLTHWGLDHDMALRHIENAIDGEFGSWVAPERELVSDVAARLTASCESDDDW